MLRLQSEQKWKQLAELATTKCQFNLAQECLHQAQDYGGLLLLATASGNTAMVGKLAEGAERDGKTNVAFLTYFLQGRWVEENKWEGKGSHFLNPNFSELVFILVYLVLSFSVFAQIGQMSGHSHQNRSVARGCIFGKNISAQPCAEVKLFLPCACPAQCRTYQLPVICHKDLFCYPEVNKFKKSKSKSVGKLCYP